MLKVNELFSKAILLQRSSMEIVWLCAPKKIQQQVWLIDKLTIYNVEFSLQTHRLTFRSKEGSIVSQLADMLTMVSSQTETYMHHDENLINKEPSVPVTSVDF